MSSNIQYIRQLRSKKKNKPFKFLKKNNDIWIKYPINKLNSFRINYSGINKIQTRSIQNAKYIHSVEFNTPSSSQMTKLINTEGITRIKLLLSNPFSR